MNRIPEIGDHAILANDHKYEGKIIKVKPLDSETLKLYSIVVDIGSGATWEYTVDSSIDWYDSMQSWIKISTGFEDKWMVNLFNTELISVK
jgi:hypothetical protein